MKDAAKYAKNVVNAAFGSEGFGSIAFGMKMILDII
jgi:hypothetical protein